MILLLFCIFVVLKFNPDINNFLFRLRSNLKQLADQYALSEQQHAQRVNSQDVQKKLEWLLIFYKDGFSCLDFDVQLKQKELELQIADLKIKQHEEKLVQEQSQMKLYAEQVSQLLATEKNLRLQLTADGEKFQQFQVNFLFLCLTIQIISTDFI